MRCKCDKDNKESCARQRSTLSVIIRSILIAFATICLVIGLVTQYVGIVLVSMVVYAGISTYSWIKAFTSESPK